MKYFKDVSNREDLKTHWKKLCKIHHPDKGGDILTMQLINSEYEEALKSGKFGSSSEVEKDLSSYYASYQAEIEKYQAQVDSYMEEIRKSMESINYSYDIPLSAPERDLPPLLEIDFPNFSDIVIHDIDLPNFNDIEFDSERYKTLYDNESIYPITRIDRLCNIIQSFIKKLGLTF